MSEGFKKGKLPDRFKGWTAQTIEMTPSSYIANICDTAIKEENKLMEDKIVCHLNAYYDDELMAAQYVTKMKKLEKALDKACQVLENLDKRSLHYQEKYFRSIGCDDEVEFAMIKEEWKEWLLRDD